MKKLMLLAACMILAFTVQASAGPLNPLNYNPSLTPPAPILGAGWAYDQINAAFVPSVDSPYIYNLGSAAVFTITDDFVVGDVYQVFDFGVLILTTAIWGAMPPFGPGDPFGWVTAGYAKGQILLAPGPHQLVVMGNGAGGIPAGFYTRIDNATVPEPGLLLILCIGIGAVSLAAWRCRN
jgi:hypothetical protein